MSAATRRFGLDLTLVTNAASLVGATAVTSGLGFVYWWLAARSFPTAQVGLASAATSAMLLLGSFGTLGLGTLLVGELPRWRGQAGPLLFTALLVAGAASTALGLVFALGSSRIAPTLTVFGRDPLSCSLFALGVGLTGLTLVLDQGLVGILRGDLQLWRNAIGAVVKLFALPMVGLVAVGAGSVAIFAAWTIGNLVSLVVLAIMLVRGGTRVRHAPRWELLRNLRGMAFRHHALNLAVQGSTLALPLVVTATLSPSANAGYYVSWMVAGFVFVVPNALTTVLYAIAAERADALAAKLHFTLKWSFALSLVSAALLTVGAPYVLAIFGESYVLEADHSLRILSWAALPMVLKVHYVALERIRNRLGAATRFAALGGALELVLAALGARVGGLEGLCVGLVIAFIAEAAWASIPVFVFGGAPTVESDEPSGHEKSHVDQ